MPFGLRVPTFEGEPPISLLARLAARHGARKVGGFAKFAGLDARGLHLGHGVDRLAASAGADGEDLAMSSPVVDAGARTVRWGIGDPVGMLDWSARKRRWCPLCFAADEAAAREAGVPPVLWAHHRTWWDVLPAAHCPLHGVLLLSRCPSCGNPPSWRAAPPAVCDCGFRLSRAPPVRWSGPASDYFRKRAARGVIGEPLLDCFSISGAARLLECTASLLKSPWSASAPRRRRTPDALEEAYQALLRPECLEKAVDRLASGRDGRPPGLIGAYGWFYEHWARLLPDRGAGQVLRSAFRDHAVRNGVIAPDETVLGFQGPRCQGLIVAAGTLGRGSSTASRTLRAAGAVRAGARRGVRHSIPPRGLQEVAAERRRWTGLSGLANILGVGRKQAGRVGRRFLRQVPERPQDAGRRFSMEEARALVRRCRRGAPPRGAPPVGTLRLAEAAQSTGLKVEDLVSAVLDGRLRPAAVLRGEPGLSGVLVPRDEALKLARGAEDNGELDLQGAATELGLHPETVLHLLRRSILSGAREAARWRVPRGPVSAFARLNCSGSEAARILGTSPKAAAAHLRAAGVPMLCGPPLVRQYVFDRSAVLKSADRRRR